MASTGGPEDSYRPDGYNRYFFDAFLPPYEQTAALCGMRLLPPLVLHGAHRVDDADARPPMRRSSPTACARYPDWPETGRRSTARAGCDGAGRRAARPTDPSAAGRRWNTAPPG